MRRQPWTVCAWVVVSVELTLVIGANGTRIQVSGGKNQVTRSWAGRQSQWSLGQRLNGQLTRLSLVP
jgi:hypothetical protein